MTRVALIGNGKHPFCTESYLARALRDDLACQVTFFQQEAVHAQGPDLFVSLLLGRGDQRVLGRTGAYETFSRPDLVLYVRTHNGSALGHAWTHAWQQLQAAGVVTASFHLDRFFGLEREHLVWDHDPLFTTQHVFTADGGDHPWTQAGVNHHWLPPAVDRVEAGWPGVHRREWAYDVVFVGSGARTYHREYPQRGELLAHLARTYGRRFAHFGAGGTHPVVRGQALNDLLCSAKVVVGDSCFANEPGSARSVRYWSDRIPETVGRGGFLIHPDVPGVQDAYGSTVLWYEPGDWAALDGLIGTALEHPEMRNALIEPHRATVLAEHTYTHRMRALLDACGVLDPASLIG